MVAEARKRQSAGRLPHEVEIRIPAHGLGIKLNAMYRWCRTRGIRQLDEYATSTAASRPGIRDAQVWHFKDMKTADAFAVEFGGVLTPGRR